MSRMLFTAATLCAALFLTETTEAGVGSQFRAGISHFRRTAPGRWEELQNGVPTFTFVETAANPNLVLLYDASRGITLKLSPTRNVIMSGPDTLMSVTGGWSK
ncbi:MAG TPA: hypothetical protein PLY87_29260 [Planctomycetaceae bacterium]|nr:hypothetical protein [Planctomycetaceae bacterium]HQZ69225.1 hypothetical protein [Planctomycetaceae bacterium]HRA87691.1 hypothetical protein [Planctomycetaceae bacterium]